MDVHDTIDLGNGHLIEVGASTWDPNSMSVRNRYPTTDGRFSPHSSSEIPLWDLEPLLSVVAKHDLLPPETAAKMIRSLAESIERQCTAAEGES